MSIAASTGFAGARVVSFESRRAAEMTVLIEKNGGVPTVAPSMREAPREDNSEALAFIDRLFAGEFETLILLTGVGTRALAKIAGLRHEHEAFLAELAKRKIVVRGPKPNAVCREWNVRVDVRVPEPNTWRDLLDCIGEIRVGEQIAVQEYGRPNRELIDALRKRGAEVTPVPVYSWALPEDTAPLAAAIRQIAAGEADVAMFTTRVQVDHMLQFAEELGLESAVSAGLAKMMIASIGPIASETLAQAGFAAHMEPSHPKMGILVKEAAEQSAEILARIRQS